VILHPHKYSSDGLWVLKSSRKWPYQNFWAPKSIILNGYQFSSFRAQT